jgi:hypothetical protein
MRECYGGAKGINWSGFNNSAAALEPEAKAWTSVTTFSLRSNAAALF